MYSLMRLAPLVLAAVAVNGHPVEDPRGSPGSEIVVDSRLPNGNVTSGYGYITTDPRDSPGHGYEVLPPNTHYDDPHRTTCQWSQGKKHHKQYKYEIVGWKWNDTGLPESHDSRWNWHDNWSLIKHVSQGVGKVSKYKIYWGQPDDNGYEMFILHFRMRQNETERDRYPKELNKLIGMPDSQFLAVEYTSIVCIDDQELKAAEKEKKEKADTKENALAKKAKSQGQWEWEDPEEERKDGGKEAPKNSGSS